MNKKDQAKLNKFNTEVEPLIDELNTMLVKHKIPALISVQVYKDKAGAHILTYTAGDENMESVMQLSTEVLRNHADIMIDSNNSCYVSTPHNKNIFKPKKTTKSRKEPEPIEFYEDDDFDLYLRDIAPYLSPKYITKIH